MKLNDGKRTPKMKIKIQHIAGMRYYLKFDSPRLPTTKPFIGNQRFKTTNGITIISDQSPGIYEKMNCIYIHGSGFQNDCKFEATKEFLIRIFDALDEFANNNFEWNTFIPYEVF